MIEIGKFNKLKVIKKEPHGYYLDGDDDWGSILLPNKFSPSDINIGDDINVFVYLDSEDIIIATTQKPLAQVGQFASLKVSSVAEIGVFLDWGLDKDLFVPFREQVCEMKLGQNYVVYVYVDNSDRIAASTRTNKFIDKSKPSYEPGQQVDLLLYQTTDLGIKAIVDGRFSGLIFKDDTIHHLKLGQTVKGYIKNIREDGKIDLKLSPLKQWNLGGLQKVIIEELEKNNGTLNISSKSSAEEINALFNVSRKQFKVALGALYKKKIITASDTSIKLNKK